MKAHGLKTPYTTFTTRGTTKGGVGGKLSVPLDWGH